MRAQETGLPPVEVAQQTGLGVVATALGRNVESRGGLLSGSGSAVLSVVLGMGPGDRILLLQELHSGQCLSRA